MMKAVMRGKTELRDSEIEWIGQIPADWKVMTIKYTSWLKGRIGWQGLKSTEFVDNGPYLITGTDFKNGIVNWETCAHITDDRFIEDEDIHIVEDDLLITKDGTIGKIAIAKNCPEKVSLNSGVLLIRNDKIKYIDKYLYYTLLSEEFILWYELNQPQNSTIRHLYQGQFYNFKFAFPPYEEQQRIANYLDDRCSKIDAIIAEAKASIEEYKELKQAVIHQAVTLGIKKNRALKDTNILWIGKTPCDWQVAELKFFASIKSGITLGQKYPAGAKLVEIPYLRVANVQGEYVDLSDVKTIQVLPEEVDKYRLEAGVVLMTEGGDRDKLGRGCVWHGDINPCLHQNHVFAVTTKSDKLLPEYFSHVTTSEVARCYFDYTAKKTTNLANTNSSTIMNFRLPIPPLEEQREIVKYLDKRIKTLNEMISEKRSLIEDLEAYKKSLIYEVVTGKRKVVA